MRIEIPGMDMTAFQVGCGIPWDVLDGKGNVLAILPCEYTEREVTIFCAGFDAGHRDSMPTGFRTGYETGRRIMRGDVLKALGAYDSTRELQAQTRILTDIAKMEEVVPTASASKG